MKTFVFILFASAATTFGATYYVNSAGGDDGRSTATAQNLATPWLTIQHAADTMIAGDTVRVQAGTYAERVTETTDGTSAARITYLAEGAVVLLGFYLNGADYVSLIGFEIYHTTGLNYSGVVLNGVTRVEVIDCNIHHTRAVSNGGDAANIEITGTSSWITIRGNTLAWPGYSYPSTYVQEGAAVYLTSGSVTNLLVEHNTMSHVSDYIGLSGSSASHIMERNNTLGPCSAADYGGLPHADGIQANCPTPYVWQDANWHFRNEFPNSHLNITSQAGCQHWTIRRNVSILSGDNNLMILHYAFGFLIANNTVGDVGTDLAGQTIAIYNDQHSAFGGTNSGIVAVNSMWWNTPDSANVNAHLYYSASGDPIVHANDIAYPYQDDAASSADPLFVNYPSNVLVSVGSPTIDTGGKLTATTGSGSTSTIVTVTNSYWFHDTMAGLIAGDRIYVGTNNNLLVVSNNTASGGITVSAPISWSAGAAVGYAYRGSGPDIGAYEFGDTLMMGATISQDGTTYTVTPTGDTRFVVFYTNGIPTAPDYDSPYAFTRAGSETVTAKAYALHAQANPVILASASTNAATQYRRQLGGSVSSGNFRM